MANAVDEPFVVARPTQAFDPRIRDVQAGQGRIVIQRYRMVDAQGQQYLGLDVGGLGIHFGINENRRHLGGVVPRCLTGGQHLQADRLADQLIETQRRYDHEAGSLGHQADDPARYRLGASVQLADQAELATVADVEMFFQGREVRLGEAIGRFGFQSQLQCFALYQTGAVNTCFQGSLGRNREQQ